MGDMWDNNRVAPFLRENPPPPQDSPPQRSPFCALQVGHIDPGLELESLMDATAGSLGSKSFATSCAKLAPSSDPVV